MFMTVSDIREANVRRTNGGLYIGKDRKEDTGITKRLNRDHKAANHRQNAEVRRQMNISASQAPGRNPRPGKIVGPAAPYRYTTSGPKLRG